MYLSEAVFDKIFSSKSRNFCLCGMILFELSVYVSCSVVIIVVEIDKNNTGLVHTQCVLFPDCYIAQEKNK